MSEPDFEQIARTVMAGNPYQPGPHAEMLAEQLRLVWNARAAPPTSPSWKSPSDLFMGFL